MKLLLTKPQLLRSIHIIQSGVATRSTLPILSYFLLEWGKNKMKLSATDLEICVKYEFEFEASSEGAIAIPAKIFGDIIKELPEGKKIELNIEDTSIEINCGAAKFSLKGAHRDEFPQLPEVKPKDKFSIKAVKLKDMLDKTSYAMSTEETRYTLNGVYFTAKDGILKLISSDGRRLSYIEEQIQGDVKIGGIVPSKAVNELSKILSLEEETEDIKINFTESQVSFEFKNITFISRLIEGTFPNYEQVIPKKHETLVTIDCDELISTTRQASLCAQSRTGPVSFSFKKDKLTVRASSPAAGTLAEINIPIQLEGNTVDVAFNPIYLLDFLKTVTNKKIAVKLSGSLSPALFQPVGEKNYLYIVMPIKL